MKMERETPWGLSNHAKGFLKAAAGVCSPSGVPDTDCLLAYYNLVCISIELSCKALLMGDGMAVKSLRGKFGHSLSALVGEIERRGLFDEFSLSDRAIVRLMSADYKARKYAYRLGGYGYKLVCPPLPLEVAARLSDVVVNKLQRVHK